MTFLSLLGENQVTPDRNADTVSIFEHDTNDTNPKRTLSNERSIDRGSPSLE